MADLNLDALAPKDHSVTIDGVTYAVPAEIGIPKVIESVQYRRQLMEAETQVRHLSVENSLLQAEYLALAKAEETAGTDSEERTRIAEQQAALDARFDAMEASFGEAEQGVDKALNALYQAAMGFLRMRDPDLGDLNLTPRHTMAILGLVAGAEDGGGVAEAVTAALGGGEDPTQPKPEKTMAVPKPRKKRTRAAPKPASSSA
jgi:hypothetical protein